MLTSACTVPTHHQPLTPTSHAQLDRFIKALVNIPHVCSMNVTKNFVGMHGSDREVSLHLTDTPLGMRIQPGVYVTNKDQNTRDSHLKVARIVSIRHPEVCQGLVSVGDYARRFNGTFVGRLDFSDPATHAQFRRRPAVIHFVQPINKPTLADGGTDSSSSGKENKIRFREDILSPQLYIP